MLLAKEWATSPALSQAPLLLLPQAYLDLSIEPLKPLKRNTLSEKECKELLVSMKLPSSSTTCRSDVKSI